MNRTLVIALASIPAFMAFAAPASARTHDTPTEDRSVSVSYADLDLNTQKGADRLLRRVQRAARIACGGNFGRVSLAERQQIRQCMTGAADVAVAQIQSPILTARYIERTGRDPRNSVVVTAATDD